MATRPVKASDRHPYKPASPAVLEAIETAAALGLDEKEVRLLAFPEIDSRTWEERMADGHTPETRALSAGRARGIQEYAGWLRDCASDPNNRKRVDAVTYFLDRRSQSFAPPKRAEGQGVTVNVNTGPQIDPADLPAALGKMLRALPPERRAQLGEGIGSALGLPSATPLPVRASGCPAAALEPANRGDGASDREP